MKVKILASILGIFLISCKETTTKKSIEIETATNAIMGQWDNFQQYWLENTETDSHRVETDDKHRHLSLVVTEGKAGNFLMQLREGRNGKKLVDEMSFSEADLSGPNFQLDGDTLYISGQKYFKNIDRYKFIRVRKFSGWIEYPMESAENGMYHQGNLEIHDQGGMAELDVDGVDYTVELTQLLFAKKLAIMKLAVYDMPMDSVGINSRSISYTWTNPEAKRLGINLRKVVSGWTLIEPGFQNQNSWRKQKEEE